MWEYVYPSHELYHHGIAGMKWGKKNGPPYPLAASAHSAAEKKAGWRKSLSKAVVNSVHGVKKAVTSDTAKAAMKKAAKVTNSVAVKAHIKPKFLMSDEELDYSIERLKREHTYKRAMKGKFGDITRVQEEKGKTATQELLSSIGHQVALPLVTGGMNYLIAKKLAGNNSRDIDVVKTIMGNKVTMKGENKKGNKKKEEKQVNQQADNKDGTGNTKENQSKNKNDYSNIWDTVDTFKKNREKRQSNSKGSKTKKTNKRNRREWEQWFASNYAQGYKFH